MNTSTRTKIGKSLLLAALVCSCTTGAFAALTVPKPACSQGAYTTYVNIKWSSVSGAGGYFIFRSTSSDMDTAELVGIALSSPFQDKNVKPGTKYYYWVCPSEDAQSYSYNASKYASGYAKKVTVPKPSASDGKYTGYIKITWKAVPGADGYGLYQSPTKDFDDGELVYATTSTSVTYESVPGKKYYFWVVPVVNGYTFYSKKSYDVGWRRKMLQIATPLYALVDETSYWILALNGTSVASTKTSLSCDPKKCAEFTAYGEPDDDDLSGDITGLKKGTAYLTAKYSGLTVKSKAIKIVNSNVSVSTVYGN